MAVLPTLTPGLPELSQNIWERYGFRGNPFNTQALSASAESILPIAQAIVGRGMESPESQLLTNFLRNPGGGRVIVEGDVGVGKTTFVNYHRYLWENEAKDKLLTPTTEISVYGNWEVRDFLMNVLGSIINKLLLLYGEKTIHEHALLREIFLFNRVFLQRSIEMQVSILGFGGGYGQTTQVTVPTPSEAQLHEYFYALVNEVRKMGYSGVLLHLNNMELLSLRDPKRTQKLFDEIRDTLQTPNVYYVFVAQRGFFQQVIAPLERVRSVFFGQPIILPPLTKPQVVDAVNKRYQILAADGKFIRPVSDGLIEYLYDLYAGKIRFVMDSVNTVVANLPQALAQTLDADSARAFLARLVFERIRHQLTKREWEVLSAAVKLDDFTNSDLTTALKQRRQNVTKYLNTLLAKNFIYPYHRDGRHVRYRASEDVRVIRDIPENEQASLFD
ncbi:MarR family winged helix-turn-helix transcriptional regulator [candidate division KSB1 bacterium]|nr:MarR family winged helix-turn-helix transcriptional regulator [candidate division KSB1 bacterium]